MEEAMELLVKAQELLDKEYEGRVQIDLNLHDAKEEEAKSFAEEAGQAFETWADRETHDGHNWYKSRNRSETIEVSAFFE